MKYDLFVLSLLIIVFILFIPSSHAIQCGSGCSISFDGKSCVCPEGSSDTSDPQAEVEKLKGESKDPAEFSDGMRDNPTFGNDFKSAETPPYNNPSYKDGDGDIPDSLKKLLGWPMDEHVDDDGWYQDELARSYQPVGYRLGLRYSISEAKSFRVDRYEFNDIRDSDFYVKTTGKLGVADVTSAKDHNEFKWYNPIAHVIDPANTDLSYTRKLCMCGMK